MEYKTIDAINQSTLKQILKNPQAYLKQRDKFEDSKEDYFVFGSLVDDMLLSPKIIDNKYYVMKAHDISDAIKNIVKFVYDMSLMMNGTASLNHPDLEQVIIQACQTYEWQPRWGNDAKLKNIREKGVSYFFSLKEAKGKIIITQEEYDKAIICSSAIRADDFTKEYLIPTQNNTIYTHKVVVFEMMGEKCKGEIDEVYIDHQKKTITPIDYKTTGMSIIGFNYEFWKHRYDFQAAFYLEGLRLDSEIQQLIIDGYSIKNFRYIVVEKDLYNPPMIFTVPNNVISIGFSGGRLSNGRYLEGVKQAMDKLKFHMKENLWDYPMEYYVNDGTLHIEL